MKMARIAVILLLGILLLSGLACGSSIKGTVELPPGFQGVVEVEHEPGRVDTIFGEVFVVNGLIWNMGTERINFLYAIEFRDSRGRLLNRFEPDPTADLEFPNPPYWSLAPGEHERLFGDCYYYSRVASYKIILWKP